MNYDATEARWSYHDNALTVAGGLGFEPKLKASKASVLPLDDPPMIEQKPF